MLVVIAIIGIIVGLTIPAIMAAREAGRRVGCQNNLRQIATAIEHHEVAHRHYPTDGWGYQWAGDPDRGFGYTQPGGWIYNILPYMEQNNLRKTGRGLSPLDKRATMSGVLATPLELLHCPSRRDVQTYLYGEQNFPLLNADVPKMAAKTDYAINAGDENIDAFPGPPSTVLDDLRNYRWPDHSRASGIAFVLSMTPKTAVTDGLSTTVLVGEKYLAVDEYETGISLGDDQAMYIGDDADIRRWTSAPPLPDWTNVPDIEHFGGPHNGGCYFAFCDGSVRMIRYEIDYQVFRHLGNRHDGQVIDESKL
jgi:prepilin-type processing-associated H-X9-DG protein